MEVHRGQWYIDIYTGCGSTMLHTFPFIYTQVYIAFTPLRCKAPEVFQEVWDYTS